MSFSSQNEKELLVGVRDDVEEDANKRNKSDFVLWFTKSKFDDQELKWRVHGVSAIPAGISSAHASA